MELVTPQPRRGGGPAAATLPPWPQRLACGSGLREVEPPAQALLVTLDLLRIRDNLSLVWGRRLSPQEVRDFLARAGFREAAAGDGWIANDSLLMRLDPSEVLSAEPHQPRATRRRPSRN